MKTISTCLSRRFLYLILLPLLLAAPAQAQRGGAGTQDPVQRATEMKRAGASASDVALELQQAFRQQSDQVAATLRRVGYRADDTAEALYRALRQSGSQATQALLTGGFEQAATLAALLGQQVPLEDVAAGFTGAKVSKRAALQVFLRHASGSRRTMPVVIVGVLRGVGYSYTAEEKAEQLEEEGYSAQEAAEVLQEDGHSAEEIMEALLAAGYTVAQAAEAVLRVVIVTVSAVAGIAAIAATAGGTSSVIAAAAAGAGVAIGVVAGGLQQAGLSLAEIFEALLANYEADDAVVQMKQLGMSETSLADKLEEEDYTAQQTAALLMQAGFTVAQITGALDLEYDLTVTENAQALNQAGSYNSDVAKALSEVLNADADETWEALTAIGVPTGPTKVVLLKDAGYGATDIGQELYDDGITAETAAQWLYDAVFSFSEIHQALTNTFNKSSEASSTIISNLQQ